MLVQFLAHLTESWLMRPKLQPTRLKFPPINWRKNKVYINSIPQCFEVVTLTFISWTWHHQCMRQYSCPGARGRIPGPCLPCLCYKYNDLNISKYLPCNYFLRSSQIISNIENVSDLRPEILRTPQLTLLKEVAWILTHAMYSVWNLRT